jgi:anti-sigma factor RsiW
MNCPNQVTLSAFCDGELSEGESGAIRRHVAECRDCRQFVNELRLLGHLGRAALAAIPAASSPAANVIQVTAQKHLSPRFFSLTFAAAAAVLAWCIFLWPNKPHPKPLESKSATRQSSGQIQQSEDAAFEQWAAPYRRLQIPLVPLDEAASYKPAPVQPFKPENIERNPL